MTLYDILGVPDNATLDQIKKQYRKLSLEHHPDRPTGNANKFKELNEAYELLSDEGRRKDYDNSLKPQVNLFDTLFNPERFMNPEFIFRNLFRPPPMMTTIQLTLDQSYTGCKLPITIERWVHANQIQQMEKETMYIDIPPGIDSNESIMIPNKGNMGPDGLLGDIRISIQINNPTKLERHGLDLYYTHDITLKESLCGFEFDLVYLQGQTLRITNVKNIVTPHYKKIIPQMGMKRDGSVGNLIIQFNVVFPTTLSETTLQQLEALL
jgi:DnaJ-class molecular chaperone